MKSKIFDNEIPGEMNGQMWGLTGVGAPASAAAQAAALAAQGAQQTGQGQQGHSQQQLMHAMQMSLGNGQFNFQPSTPTANSANPAQSQTPGPGQNTGHVTPSGVFGNFSYGN
ncbi:hypothetical protein LTS18_006559, partial [Coniosporium uncinatum]